jgi:hypothetical protein
MKRPSLFLLAVSVFFLVFEAMSGATEPPRLDGWVLAYPTQPGGRLNSAAWGPDLCVAVGEQSRLMHSADGRGWEESTSPEAPPFNEWSDICYGNGRFVVVGGNHQVGAIATSTDGISWQAIEAGELGMLRSVSFGNGRFAAVGEHGVFGSADGLDWRKETSTPVLANLVYGNGMWLGTDGNGRSYRSEDLVSWTGSWSFPNFPLSRDQRGIAFGNGRFVIAGGYHEQGGGTSSSVIEWSTDGAVWLTGTTEDEDGMWGVQTDVAFANGCFVAVGASTQDVGYRSLRRSTDGTVWTRGTINFPHTVAGYLTGVAGRDGKPFVAVSTSGEILISPDGLAWELAADEPREYFTRLHSANGRHVALAGQQGFIGGPLGRALVFTSNDGFHWTPRPPALDEYGSGLAYGNGLWVITGDNGRILTSTDTVTWTDHSLPATTNDLRHLAFGNGRFVALSYARDRIYHSTDGSSWTMVDQPFGDGPGAGGANAIEFLNGRFRVVGNAGLVACSNDGLVWQSKTIHPSADFQSVAFGKGRLVLGGYDHYAVADGEGAFTVIAEEGDSIAPAGILYQAGWFVSSDLRVSRDGVHWSDSRGDGRFPFYSRWDHAIPAGNRLLACSGLEIRQVSFTPTMPSALPLAQGGAEFLTHSGDEHRVWTSIDLTSSSTLTPWRPGTGDYILVPGDMAAPRKFWWMETRPAVP